MFEAYIEKIINSVTGENDNKMRNLLILKGKLEAHEDNPEFMAKMFQRLLVESGRERDHQILRLCVYILLVHSDDEMFRECFPNDFIKNSIMKVEGNQNFMKIDINTSVYIDAIFLNKELSSNGISNHFLFNKLNENIILKNIDMSEVVSLKSDRNALLKYVTNNLKKSIKHILKEDFPIIKDKMSSFNIECLIRKNSYIKNINIPLENYLMQMVWGKDESVKDLMDSEVLKSSMIDDVKNNIQNNKKNVKIRKF